MENMMPKNRIKKCTLVPCDWIKGGSFGLHKQGKGIRALKESIKQNGLIVPISLRFVHDEYVVVDGERRLAAWCEIYPSQPIPAIVLNYVEDELGQEKEGGNNNEQMRCDAFTANLARAKIPKEKVEAIVLELREKGMGLGKIANCIGYKKSGVQKIVMRLENRNQSGMSTSVNSKKKTIAKLKQARTILKNILKDIGEENVKDKELFQQMDEFLEALKDLYIEDVKKESSSEDAEG